MASVSEDPARVRAREAHRESLGAATRLSREGSGYLGRFRLSRAVSSYLEPPGYLERAQVVSSISGHLEAASSYLVITLTLIVEGC